MMGELHAYVGRQAIFDRRLDVVGYELLYRDSEENRARFNDVTQASAQTMLNAFLEMGLDNLVGKVPAYVNMAADFLLGNYPIPLPPERTVIEVLENIPVTPALIEALQGLRAQGYKIALDDFILTEESRPLLSVAIEPSQNASTRKSLRIVPGPASRPPPPPWVSPFGVSTRRLTIFSRESSFATCSAFAM